MILLPAAAAKRLCDSGRLSVGLVYARVRPTELLDRCYRCHVFGHVARECAGTDRGGCCWRCGGPGHQSRSCTATLQAVRAFREESSNAANADARRGRQLSKERPVPDAATSGTTDTGSSRGKDGDVNASKQ